MRNMIIGVVLAVILLASLAYLAMHRGPSVSQLPAQAAAEVEPGFTGGKQIGAWRLGCAPVQKTGDAPLPLTLTPFGKRGPHATAEHGLGRCRLFLSFRRKGDTKKIAARLVFRTLKRNGDLALIAALPPITTDTKAVFMRIGDKVVRLRLTNCNTERCVAVAAIHRGQEAALLSGAGPGFIVVRGKGGPRKLLEFPVKGLQVGINAMRRAEI